MKKIVLIIAILFLFANAGYAGDKQERELKEPGQKKPRGNRGYVYVYKIIFDYKYKEEELLPPKPKELCPSLLIKKIIKNIKVYFNYDSAALRDDAHKILLNATGILKRNLETSILITGNCDRKSSEAYNELGDRRGDSVKKFMLENGINEERMSIINRGKLDAIAPLADFVGMQKDRNVQFMIVESEEVMMPYPDSPQEIEAKPIEEEKVESSVKVSTGRKK